MAKQEVPQAATDEQIASTVDGDEVDDTPETTNDALAAKVINMGDEQMRQSAVLSAQREEYSPYLEPGAYHPPRLGEVKDSKTKEKIQRIAKLARVKVSDVVAFNADSNTAVTAQGGKYQMNRKGTQLRVLAGPVPEGVTTEAEAAKQERLEKAANAEA